MPQQGVARAGHKKVGKLVDFPTIFLVFDCLRINSYTYTSAGIVHLQSVDSC